MGWLFIPGSTRKELVADRTEGWERTLDNGVTVQSRSLAHCYRGNLYTGVLWTVWERTFANYDGSDQYATQRWIQADVLRYSKADDGWGYKDDPFEAVTCRTFVLYGRVGSSVHEDVRTLFSWRCTRWMLGSCTRGLPKRARWA